MITIGLKYNVTSSNIMISIDYLNNMIRDCTDCWLCKDRTNAVPGEGPIPCDLMFIGRDPGKEEDKQGRPFVGKSGKLLTKVLNECGINREDVYITNLVKCRPPKNREPTLWELRACEKYILQEIAQVKPKLVISLGSYTSKYFLGPLVMHKVKCKRFEVVKPVKFTLVPMYHPSFIVRSMNLYEEYLEDMKRILNGV